MTTAIAAPVAPAAAAPANTTTPPAQTNGAEPNAVQKPVAPKPNETPQEKAWRLKKKIKVNGKEHDVDMGEDDVVREIQKARHSETTRGEFDKKVAEFEARQRKLAEDPDAFFQENGIDLETILSERAKRAEQMKALSPEQQEMMRLRQEIQKRDVAEQKRQQTDAQRAEQQAQYELVQQTFNRIDSAIKLSGLPRAPETLKLYAEVQELAEYAGEPEMSPQQIVAAGEKLLLQRLGSTLKVISTNEAWRGKNAEMLAELGKAVLPNLKGDALLTWLGPEMVKAVTAAAWAKTRGSPTPIIQEPPRNAPTQNAQAAQISQWDVMDKFGG